MNEKTSELHSAIAVVVLLLLTAIGNAWLMMAAGAVGLAIGLIGMKGKSRGYLAALSGCAVAIVVAIFFLLR